MAAGLKLCTLLLVTVTMFGLTAGDCPSGWFGKDCRFMCHCKLSRSCDPDGRCHNGGECLPGYFGPGCQYVDLLFNEATVANKDYIADNDDTTCNPDAYADTETIYLRQPVPFMWFRIVVKDSTYLNNFTLLMNEASTRCDNERRTRVDNVTLDVSCDSAINLYEVNLQGPMVASICTVHISGGRNVALKQNATHSSDVTESRVVNVSLATNAVDGSRVRTFANGSCTRTAVERKVPEWYLQFDRPQLIIRVLIYTAEGAWNLLFDFKLTTFREDGNATNTYINSATLLANCYDIPLPSREPVTSVTVKGPTNLPASRNFLTLCEVETYGETLCPEGLYGLDCDKTCLCDSGQHCNIVTGACSKGCGPLYYGFNCSFVCHGNCFEDLCGQRSGRCQECKPGYQNINCSEGCDPGSYGKDCKFNCSLHCSDVCDKESGLCNCTEPFGGRHCEDCPDGWFGNNCTLKCGLNCELNKCHRDDGTCLKCPDGYVGKFCEDCPKGHYGFQCSSLCSAYCGNETCNPNDGSCLSCKGGYSGYRCAIGPPAVPIKWPYFLILIPIVLVLLISGFLIRRKLSPSGEEETEE